MFTPGNVLKFEIDVSANALAPYFHTLTTICCTLIATLNSMVGCSQGTPRGCESGPRI